MSLAVAGPSPVPTGRLRRASLGLAGVLLSLAIFGLAWEVASSLVGTSALAPPAPAWPGRGAS